MAGPITGQKGAFLQPGRWGRNETGNYSVLPFEGSKREVYQLAATFAQTLGLKYEVIESFGKFRLEVYFPWNTNGINPTTDKVTGWEFFAEHEQKDLLSAKVENPNTIAALSAQQIEKLRNLKLNPPDGKITPFPVKSDFIAPTVTDATAGDDGSNALAIWLLMSAGVESWPVEAPVLRNTIITSNQYAVPASLLNARKIISSSSLITLEQMPSALLFSLPFETADSKTGLAYGWYKEFPTIQEIALLKWQIVFQYRYGLWATYLWGQPL